MQYAVPGISYKLQLCCCIADVRGGTAVVSRWSSLTDELVRKFPAMIRLSIELCAFGFAARKKRSFSVLKNVP